MAGETASKIAARVAALAGPDDGDDGGEVDTTETETAVAADSGTTAETIEAATGDGAEPPKPPDELSLRKQLLAEKIVASREERLARQEARARRDNEGRTKSQLDAELDAARAEKAKYERLGKAPFKEVLQELGRDPLATWREMNEEAINTNTPEGQLREFQLKIAGTLDALNKKIDALESGRTKDEETRQVEREQASERETAARFEANFTREIQDPKYRALRVAYEDDDILAYANQFRKNPQQMKAAADSHGVRLTDPRRGFTMSEILAVLKAAQDNYDAKRKTREARLSGQSSGQAGRSTVNGATAPEAVSTIGSDLASSRSSGGERRKLTREEKIDAEIERYERQR